jgi:hypothetical protein
VQSVSERDHRAGAPRRDPAGGAESAAPGRRRALARDPTVEMHLTAAYRKLDVSGRGDLPTALAAAT